MTDKVDEHKLILSAFDAMDTGIVLVDAEMNVRFINDGFLRIWQYPADIQSKTYKYRDLLSEVAALRTRPLNSGIFSKYVEEREALVRAGIDHSVDIRMINGDVTRIHCRPLADGARMLTFTNVSDLVHLADQLEVLANTDSLTGLFNRRYFFSKADQKWERFKAFGGPLSLMIIDIDRFKQINDKHGHDIGDQVIVQVAAICQRHCRTVDVVARLGGEEFAIILPEINAEDAQVVGNGIRHSLAALPRIERGPRSVTVSVGVGEATHDMTDVRGPLRRADLALYEAKQSGRDRVCLAKAS